jgi:hypothetical protein
MPMKWTPTDENFCEELKKVLLSLNNPIRKLDGLVTNGAPCITEWSCGVSPVTADARTANF